MGEKKEEYTEGERSRDYLTYGNKENLAPGLQLPSLKEPQSKKPLPRKRKTLDCVLELPLDPLFYIFSMLDPKDLVNLACANKDLRRTLISTKSPESSRLWRKKRQGSGAPPPPLGFTEPKWVSFLFLSYCYICGSSRTFTDFYLLKRLCRSCRKKNYVSGGQYRGTKEGEDTAEVLRLIPCTRYSPEFIGGGYRWYFSADIREMQEIRRLLLLLVEHGVPRAKEFLEGFRRERLHSVNLTRLLAPTAEDWVLDFKDEQYARVLDLKQRIVVLLQQKFRALGNHHLADIAAAITVSDVKLKRRPNLDQTTITEREWKAYRLFFEQRIAEAKISRHSSEYMDRVDKLKRRWQFSMTSLSARGVTTVELLSYPPAFLLARHPAIAGVIKRDLEHPLTGEDWASMVEKLPEICSILTTARRANVSHVARNSMTPGLTDPNDPLELATAVFDFPEAHRFDARVFIGWKMLSVVTNGSPNDFRPVQDPFSNWLLAPGRSTSPIPENGVDDVNVVRPSYSGWLSELSRALVKLCGLDEQRTTTDDMDRVDQRFFCVQCALRSMTIARERFWESGQIRRWYADVFTWRAALLHARIHHILGQERCHPAVFRLLDDLSNIGELRHIVDAVEASGRATVGWDVWLCNHCATYGPMQGSDVIKHLFLNHSISGPTVPRDYFFDERKRFDYERPSRFEFALNRMRT